MVGTTRDAAMVSGRDSWAATTGGEAVTTGDETAGDEKAATGGVMYTNEGELEFDEDEIAALE